jgi:hypothetical protein
MATERITVHRGGDGEVRDACWLELDNKYLQGGLRPESHAQKIAARLNAAFDKTEAGAKREHAWTKKKPTKPGWYVLREHKDSPGVLFNVVFDEDGLFHCVSDCLTTEVDAWPSGRWLGPLPVIKAGASDE